MKRRSIMAFYIRWHKKRWGDWTLVHREYHAFRAGWIMARRCKPS